MTLRNRDKQREQRRGCPERMSLRDLRRFLKPIRLADLPRTSEGGFSYGEWLDLVLNADADGLLCSPGHGPYWTLTVVGRALVRDA